MKLFIRVRESGQYETTLSRKHGIWRLWKHTGECIAFAALDDSERLMWAYERDREAEAVGREY